MTVIRFAVCVRLPNPGSRSGSAWTAAHPRMLIHQVPHLISLPPNISLLASADQLDQFSVLSIMWLIKAIQESRQGRSDRGFVAMGSTPRQVQPREPAANVALGGRLLRDFSLPPLFYNNTVHMRRSGALLAPRGFHPDHRAG